MKVPNDLNKQFTVESSCVQGTYRVNAHGRLSTKNRKNASSMDTKESWIRWSFYTIKASANTSTIRSNVRNTHEPDSPWLLILSPFLRLSGSLLIGVSSSASYPHAAGQLLLLVHPLLQHYDLPRLHVRRALMHICRPLMRSLLRACTTVFQMYVHMLKTRTYTRGE